MKELINVYELKNNKLLNMNYKNELRNMNYKRMN